MKIFFILIAIIFSFSLIGYGENNKLENGLFYLSDNEVYFCGFNHETPYRLTNTNNNITDFAVSPDYRFLVYSKIFKYVDTPGIWDSIAPKTSICSIVLYDFQKNKIIKEIYPSSNEWITIDHWINSKDLLCVSADGFAVNNWYKFQTNGCVDTVNYDEIDHLKDENFYISQDSKVKIIKDKSSLLHFIDSTNKKDTVIFCDTWDSHLKSISSDYKEYLWSEASMEYLNKERKWVRNYYKLYLRNILSGKDKVIVNKGLSPMTLFCKIQFSPDNKIISLDPHKTDYILFIFLDTNEQRYVKGKNTVWINSNQFFYFIGSDLYKYD